MKPISIDMND